MDQGQLTPVVLARATEQLRQERDTFDQARQHEARWFILRLVMGYAAVALLLAVILVASYIIFSASHFPAAVVTAAGAALFVDVLGLLIAVWKIALNPHFYARLGPVTQVKLPDIELPSSLGQDATVTTDGA
jgi:membrane-associated HD superfamily phosphohydrolase